jgi:predicted N-acetyltransferase YhbS
MMVNIIYRYYQEGDEEQLADLFNRAFQMNKIDIIRTKKSLLWRYLEAPYFEPEMIQIAEDKENKKIIGAVYAHPIEEINLNKKKYLVGDINDVSCHPDYVKLGIAKNLMKKALDYLKSKNCHISMLATKYNSFERERIY